jgi:hypothetical protein
MKIIEVETGQVYAVDINPVEEKDFKTLTKQRFSFNWKSVRLWLDNHKLQISERKNILGVMGLLDFPAEERIEIKLLASAIENCGNRKKYDRIAGCLIAFACLKAKTKYGDGACVSLIPKTMLTRHYMEKYHMLSGGRQLYLEKESLENLISEYNI